MTRDSADADADDEAVAPVDALVAALQMLETAQRHLRTRAAQEVGLTVTDLTAIGIIGDLGRITPKLLASEISMTTGSVTAMVDRLAEHVARIPNPRDRRSVLLELTPSGHETLGRFSQRYRDAAAAALRASPGLGAEAVTEDIARAAAVITAQTIEPLVAGA
jgi:DNA-binding MarR family transcriptional regulator